MTEEQIEQWFREEFDKIVASERSVEKETTDWHKHIVSVLTVVLAVLATLKPDSFIDCQSQALFSATMISTCLSVLMGTALTFRPIDTENRSISFHKESLRQRFRENDFHSPKFDKPYRVTFYKTVSFFFYTFSITSIVLICVYGLTS